MSDCSMSTTRIREVTDISPPLLYKPCLHIPINEFTSAQEKPSRTHLSFFPISYPTILNPGLLTPIIPNSSPMADSSSCDAFTNKTRF